MSKPARVSGTDSLLNVRPYGSTPAVVTLLLRSLRDEEEAIERLCEAVASGDTSAILAVARHLAELRRRQSSSAGDTETSHDLPA